MKDWEKFEINVLDFLSEKFSIEGVISYEAKGGKDPTVSDILVKNEGRLLFLVEAKFSPSQAGQFVLEKLDNRFVYKPNKNSPKKTHFQNKLIEFLNRDFDKYKDTSTKQTIKCNKKLTLSLIKEHYAKKKVKFIVTSNNLNKDYTIVPLSRIQDCFEVEVTMRHKRSGTSKFKTSQKNKIKPKVDSHLNKLKLKYKFDYNNRDYLSYEIDFDFIKKEDQYIGDSIYLSIEGNELIPKKRSNTNNLNIIYKMKFNGLKDPGWRDTYIVELFNSLVR